MLILFQALLAPDRIIPMDAFLLPTLALLPTTILQLLLLRALLAPDRLRMPTALLLCSPVFQTTILRTLLLQALLAPDLLTKDINHSHL